MSYPRDLDEIPEDELRAELARRGQARADGLCDYCGQNGNRPKCRFPERHPGRQKRVKLPKCARRGG